MGTIYQAQLPLGCFHQRLAGVIQNTVLADLRRSHVRIAGYPRTQKLLTLSLQSRQ